MGLHFDRLGEQVKRCRMMISVVATVALAVFVTLQVSATSQTDCARTIYVYVEFDEDVNKLVGGMYVLDLDADVIQYKREDGAMCMALKSEKGEEASVTTAIGETCEKREVDDRIVPGGHVSVVNSSRRWDEESSGQFPLCQPYKSVVKTDFQEWTDEDGYDKSPVKFTFISAESPCSECREVTQGDLKGFYELESIYSSYCGNDTDKCVYSNNFNDQNYCFKVIDGEYDTMLTCN